jgi:hypothetical protein
MDGLFNFAADNPALLVLPGCAWLATLVLLRLKRNYINYGVLSLRPSPRAGKTAPVPTSQDAPNRTCSLDREGLEPRMVTALLDLCALLSSSLGEGRMHGRLSPEEWSLEEQRLLSEAAHALWTAVKNVRLSSEDIEGRQIARTELKDADDASCAMLESMVSLYAKPTLLHVQSARAAVDAFVAKVEQTSLLGEEHRHRQNS